MNPEVLAAILPRVYPQMLEEVYGHQDAGRATFIVSAAGNGVVEPLAEVLGMDGGIGTRYERRRRRRLHRALRRPVRLRAGQGRGDGGVRRRARDRSRRSSYAYSDSLSDLPMLRAVGHPVAVNPDPALTELAAEEGWETMRFERLGRRLVAVAVTLLATVAGFGASRIAARRKVPPRRFPVRR